MEPLHHLVYVSSAVPNVTPAQLRHLLEHARQRNEVCQVTGVLLYDMGNFMQYIEGPEAGLREVYACIRRDPLHHGIIELCAEPVSERLFDHWTMGFRVSKAPEISQDWQPDASLESRLAALSPMATPGAALLCGFWRRSRRFLVDDQL